MSVKGWEKILAQGSCSGVPCSECDDIQQCANCRFTRADGKIPIRSNGGLDDVARAKIEAALRGAKGDEATMLAKTPFADDIAFVRKVAEAGGCWPNKTSAQVCPRCQQIGGGLGFCQTGGSRQEKAKAWLAKYAPDHGAVEAVEGSFGYPPPPLFLNVTTKSKTPNVVSQPRPPSRPETESYARVCERLYRRRFEV